MAKFQGIIEDSNYGQHHFKDVTAETKEEAEKKAIFNLSEELGDNLESFSILVCMEVLTDSQVEDFLNSSKTISELHKGDQFIFNNKTYTVQKKYRNDDSPLISECGQLFHNEDLPVKYVGKKEK